MSRACSHFIDSYMKYTDGLEAPDSFHQWAAISMISIALRRQCWIDMGHFKVFPNMYIVLVADPGVCRKTASINPAVALYEDLTNAKISADATTREALIRALKQSESSYQTSSSEIATQSALTIVSRELSVFLGNGDHDLLSLLTDLYDCPNRWEYRTKNSGIDIIHNVWLSILAASTPEWLSSSIPVTAIGGGFTSRILFIVESKSRKKVAFPVMTPEQRREMDNLKLDLAKMMNLHGPFTITPEAREYFIEWYNGHSHATIEDKRFWGYAERKHIHILKLASILSVADSDAMVIEGTHIRQAHFMIDSIEPGMMEAFGSAGRSEESFDIGIVLEIIKTYSPIKKEKLLSFIWRDVSPKIFETVINFLIDGRRIERYIDDGSTMYKHVGKED